MSEYEKSMKRAAAFMDAMNPQEEIKTTLSEELDDVYNAFAAIEESLEDTILPTVTSPTVDVNAKEIVPDKSLMSDRQLQDLVVERIRQKKFQKGEPLSVKSPSTKTNEWRTSLKDSAKEFFLRLSINEFETNSTMSPKTELEEEKERQLQILQQSFDKNNTGQSSQPLDTDSYSLSMQSIGPTSSFPPPPKKSLLQTLKESMTSKSQLLDQETEEKARLVQSQLEEIAPELQVVCQGFHDISVTTNPSSSTGRMVVVADEDLEMEKRRKLAILKLNLMAVDPSLEAKVDATQDIQLELLKRKKTTKQTKGSPSQARWPENPLPRPLSASSFWRNSNLSGGI